MRDDKAAPLDFLDLVANLKRADRYEAFELAQEVDVDGPTRISIVPIGRWLLEDGDLIAQMSEWRQKVMAFFFNQFSASPQSMRHYLEFYSIKQPNRILFLIYADEFPVGQIGLSDIDHQQASLDNMIRGELMGPRSLMLEVERHLIRWAFAEMGIERLSLVAQSRNFLAKRIHFQLGFTISEEFHLRKIRTGDRICIEPCSKEESTEDFKMEILKLEKELWNRVENNRA